MDLPGVTADQIQVVVRAQHAPASPDASCRRPASTSARPPSTSRSAASDGSRARCGWPARSTPARAAATAPRGELRVSAAAHRRAARRASIRIPVTGRLTCGSSSSATSSASPAARSRAAPSRRSSSSSRHRLRHRQRRELRGRLRRHRRHRRHDPRLRRRRDDVAAITSGTRRKCSTTSRGSRSCCGRRTSPPACPGRGSYLGRTRTGEPVGVINLMGRIFMAAARRSVRRRAARDRRAAREDARHHRRLPRRGDVGEGRDGLAPRRPRHGGVRHAHARADRRRAHPARRARPA